MKFKLLKLPENDHIKACIKTFIKKGLDQPIDEDWFRRQEYLLLSLADYYGQWPDDIYCAHLHNQFLAIYKIIDQYYETEKDK